jgi:hypothetical protein
LRALGLVKLWLFGFFDYSVGCCDVEMPNAVKWNALQRLPAEVAETLAKKQGVSLSPRFYENQHEDFMKLDLVCSASCSSLLNAFAVGLFVQCSSVANLNCKVLGLDDLRAIFPDASRTQTPFTGFGIKRWTSARRARHFAGGCG